MGGWFCEVVLWVFDFTACLMEGGRVGIGRRNTYDYIREGLSLRSRVILMLVTVSMLPSPFVQMSFGCPLSMLYESYSSMWARCRGRVFMELKYTSSSLNERL